MTATPTDLERAAMRWRMAQIEAERRHVRRVRKPSPVGPRCKWCGCRIRQGDACIAHDDLDALLAEATA